MEKTFIERLLEKCEGPTNEELIDGVCQELADAAEHVTGYSSSNEEYRQMVPEVVKNRLESNLMRNVKPKLEKYIPKKVLDKHFNSFFKDCLYELKDIDLQKYDIQKVGDYIGKLSKETKFFENCFIESLRNPKFADTYLSEKMPDEVFTTLLKRPITYTIIENVAKDAKKSYETSMDKINKKVKNLEDELNEKQKEKEKTDKERIDLLKERKNLREDIKQNPEDSVLQDLLDQSKVIEKGLLATFSEISELIRDLKDELSFQDALLKTDEAGMEMFNEMSQMAEMQMQGVDVQMPQLNQDMGMELFMH